MRLVVTFLIASSLLLVFPGCEDLDPNTFEPLPGEKPTFGADYLPLVLGDTLNYRVGVQTVGFTLGGDTTLNGELYQSMVPDQLGVDTLFYRKSGTIIFSREIIPVALDPYLFLPILDINRSVGDNWRTSHFSNNGNPLFIDSSIDGLEATRTIGGRTYTDVVRVVQRVTEEFFDPFAGGTEDFVHGINVIWYARDIGIIERSFLDGSTVRLLD
ncbi:MAG: hypothetical protein AAFV80_21340 [Bacteroidota bacterium]